MIHLLCNLFSRQRYSFTGQRLEGRSFCIFLLLIGNDEVDGIHFICEVSRMRSTLLRGYLNVFSCFVYRIALISVFLISDDNHRRNFGSLQFHLAVWRSWEADNRSFVNLHLFLFHSCADVVKLTLRTNQVKLQIYHLSVVFYLSYQNTIYFLVVNIRSTIHESKVPGGCCFLFDIEDIEIVCSEYRIQRNVLVCQMGCSRLILHRSSCCFFGIRTRSLLPMIQRMSLVVEGAVLWDGEGISFLYPYSLRG